MFVRNTTRYRPVLARGNMTEQTGIASVTVDVDYEITAGAPEPRQAPAEPGPADPPSIAGLALWAGASVTASGTVHGPSRPPYVRPVCLTVGSEVRRVIVFGDRRWEPSPSGGELRAGLPAPFEALPLSFDRAFGGSYDLPPGLDPIMRLPHPGGRIQYALNAGGRGFYRDAASAAGQWLPNIELPDQLVSRWSATPEPAGLAPCPELPGLRLSAVAESLARQVGDHSDAEAAMKELAAANALAHALRLQHYAPGRLIFDALTPGMIVRIEGLGPRALELVLPPSPVRVEAAPGRREIRPAVRRLHIDADRAIARVTYGHGFRYQKGHAPAELRVAPR
jgi:Uncharacterized protein conserved in bacteria (DUF2169)